MKQAPRLVDRIAELETTIAEMQADDECTDDLEDILDRLYAELDR